MKKIYFILIVLLFVELFLRWVNPIYFCDTISQYQYEKELGVTTKPNIEKTILTDHIIEVFTNDIGSRNYLNRDELLQYKKIVFCIGDSYTEGTGNMTDGSYPFYLDLLLNRDNNMYEKKFAVINLGLGAYGSIQSYLVSKIYTEKMGRIPNVIIYFISENDFHDDIRFKNGYRHYHIVSGSPHYYPILVTFNEALERTQLYIRIKRFLNSALRKKTYSVNETVQTESIFDDKITAKRFDPNQLPGLINLITFSKDNNIKLIISYANYKSEKYDYIKKFASENNILFSDYRPDLKHMTAIFGRLLVKHSHSGGHFRSWVNFIIASNFATLVKNREN